MKRAIVKRFIVVLIVAMAISSIVISMSYYRLASHRVMEDMKPVLLLLDATIDWESSDLEKQIVEISSQMNNDIELQLLIMMEVFWLILKLEIQRRWKITKTERKSRRLFKTALEQRCAILAQSKEV